MFLSEFVGDWVYTFSLEVVDEIFISINGFLPNILLGEEIGMGWSSGCFSLGDLVPSVVSRGSVSVIWDIDCLLCPVNYRVDFF